MYVSLPNCHAADPTDRRRCRRRRQRFAALFCYFASVQFLRSCSYALRRRARVSYVCRVVTHSPVTLRRRFCVEQCGSEFNLLYLRCPTDTTNGQTDRQMDG